MNKIAFIVVGTLGFVILSGGLFVDDEKAPLASDMKADRVIVEKARHVLELYENGAVLRAYRVSLGRGGLSPKRREGDQLTPEGLYRIDGRNPRSAYHLSLHISYPEPRDVEAARSRGEPPGSDIMIHGIRNGFGWLGSLHHRMDWTAGCIAVTNDEIEEIWRTVPDGTPVEIRP